ncbi:MAG: hypothetical protein H3C38_01650 [Rhodospirillales bacterium]|nr:hypothetical protein [Rhodospirillales bacterium]
MNKALLIVASLLPIGGLAAGGMAALGLPPFATSAGVDEAATAAPPAPPPAFVEVGLVGVPIIEDKRVVKSLVLQVKLDVDPKEKLRVEESLPRLQNNFLSDLLEFIPRHLRDRDNVDLTVVKLRLTMVCDRLLGKGVVNDVLVMSFMER